MNPRDNDSRITSGGDYIVFNGFKHFNTGGVVSDLTILEGVLDGTDQHMFVFVQTNQPGITFLVSQHTLFSPTDQLLTPAAQLEQHWSSLDRIRKRQNHQCQGALGRCSRMGYIHQDAHCFYWQDTVSYDFPTNVSRLVLL